MAASAPPPKRILFVAGTGHLPGTISGANISLHQLCERLRAMGHDPIVVCAGGNGGANAAGWPQPEYSVLRVPDPVAAMKEMIPVLAPDATVVRGPWPALAAVKWSASVSGAKLHVVFDGASFEHGFPPPSAAPGVRYAANSAFLAAVCGAMLGAPVACLPSVVEPSAYRCTPAGDAILFANALAAKGAHAVAAMAERLPHRRFLIVRPWAGADDPPVEIAAPNVETVALVPDMRALYLRCRLVLLPSVLEESGSRLVAEAQLCGIPAVAIDRGSLREDVGGGGIVLPMGAAAERWCATIESLLGDPARYAAASRAAIAQSARRERAPEAAVARFLDFVSG